MPMIQNAITVQLTALSAISMACARVSMIGGTVKRRGMEDEDVEKSRFERRY